MKLFAYLDPGTGSLVLQAIIGTFLGLIVVLRTKIRYYFEKLKTAIRKI